MTAVHSESPLTSADPGIHKRPSEPLRETSIGFASAAKDEGVHFGGGAALASGHPLNAHPDRP
jgi:hypothetical protein